MELAARMARVEDDLVGVLRRFLHQRVHVFHLLAVAHHYVAQMRLPVCNSKRWRVNAIPSADDEPFLRIDFDAVSPLARRQSCP